MATDGITRRGTIIRDDSKNIDQNQGSTNLTETKRAGTRELTFLLVGLAGITALSIDIYLPSIPSIAAEFGCSIATIQLTLAVFVFCFGAGQWVFGPLSDRIGRRGPLLTALVIYALSSLLCALAPSPTILTLGRAIQGFGASAGAVSYLSIARDRWSGQALARALAITSAAAGLAPILAPLLGAQLEITLGWRSSFIALTLFAIVWGVWIARRLPETLANNAMGNAIAIQQVLRSPDFCRYALLHAAAFSALFAFLSTSSGLLIEIRGLSVGEFSFWFASNAAVFAVSNLIIARLLRRLSLTRLVSTGALTILAGGILMAMFGDSGSTLGLMLPMGITTAGLALCLPTSASLAMQPFVTGAGRAAATLGVTRFSIAFVVGVILGAVESSLPIATTMILSGILCWGLVGLRDRPLSRLWNRYRRHQPSHDLSLSTSLVE